MPEYRKYARTRQITAYQPVVDALGEYVLMCIPKAALLVLLSLVERGYWQVTYAKSYGADRYEIPTQAEMIPIVSALTEFMENGEQAMQCNNDLITALQTIASNVQKIANKDCCQPSSNYADGVNGGGATEQPPQDLTGYPSGYPDGYASLAEYEATKCWLAEKIVDDIEESLRNVGISITAGMTIEAIIVLLGVALLIPVTGGTILALAALIFVNGLGAGYFLGLATNVNNRRGELICSLYNASDATAAKDAFLAELSASGLSAVDIQVMGYLTDYDNINRLFGPKQYDGVTPSYDCSGCLSQQGGYTTYIGNVTWTGINELTFTSEYGHVGNNPDTNWAYIEFDAGVGPYTVSAVEVVSGSVVDTGNTVSVVVWGYPQESRSEPVSNLVGANLGIAGFISIASGQPFVVKVTLQ